MSAVTASLCSTLMFVLFVSADQKTITAVPGQDVTLTCHALNKIIVLKWSRADLGDKYVLFYRNGHLDPENQHPSFKNRVDLQDRQMKDGDVSLILKNVTINDAGTYGCRAVMQEIFSWWLIRTINLHVVPPDQKTVTAESGQDVTLTCRAPNNKFIGVEWSRADLGDEYLLLYRDGQYVPDYQHPSFKNRVDLQDRQMKDGDVSLILKDVAINDAGTYECRVYMAETDSWQLISIITLKVVPPDQKNITAESGQDVTLTCRASNNIRVARWSRADLEYKNVLLYGDNQFFPANQHPSFKNRVDLQERQMKDGDVSLILKDVTINDAGTYECGVVQKEPNQMIPSLKLINIIYLHVVPPGQTGGQEKDEDKKDGGKEDKEKEDGSVGLIVGLTVPAVLVVVAAVGFLIYRRCKLNPADPHVAERLQPEYQKIITAESGQDVTLTCQAPNNNITAVKWSRADLGDEYVLVYRDGQFGRDEQHPSFKNRVDLQDTQMKDGGVSLILKDVTINDAGTYKCRVFTRKRRSWELFSIIYLHVDPPATFTLERN